MGLYFNQVVEDLVQAVIVAVVVVVGLVALGLAALEVAVVAVVLGAVEEAPPALEDVQVLVAVR